ncbi:uncharacterized protein K02A2.6 [Exaiptasia diaphana]|uniref:Integrase catalytic domain-containing protein n=1 Tax=Exaiptasia diaphana TaxID=2652724 RepID=A0A913XWX7_EXADI|nr:uncharacterized protein K02A2.6 [Exaiptasia diaphana]
MTHPIPQLPWQSVASDCVEVKGQHYVVITDLYSDYIEIAELKDETTATLVKQMKPIFATHGTPAVLTTDNGPNYASKEFKNFTIEWDIQHITISPHHHKSNGKAEAAVKTAKKIIKRAKKTGQDLWKGLLEWRNAITPGMNTSPAQRLMSRRTRTFLPCATNMYKPEVQTSVVPQIITKRRKAKLHHDKGAKELPKLIVGQPVMVKVTPQQPRSEWKVGTVKHEAATPRSYIVEVEGRKYKRNRIHLKDTMISSQHTSQPPAPSQETLLAETLNQDTPDKSTTDNTKSPKSSTATESTTASTDSSTICTRAGRLVKAPNRLNL